MEMKVPLNYTGSIKRRLTTKKLEKYYYIIDYYENGKLAKSIKNYYTKKPLEQKGIATLRLSFCPCPCGSGRFLTLILHLT